MQFVVIVTLDVYCNCTRPQFDVINRFIFFTLQLCFPLPGQPRCITIARNCYFSHEKWSKASFSSMLFELFSSHHNDYTFFYIRKNFVRKWASKTSKTQEHFKEISSLKCLSCNFLKCWFFLGLFKSYKIE